ncbi:MAG: hypothetical protein KatS3mg051_0242 [Anaerolineae bacterium]|nr:MAG: hypothetical protein KatS3mg051_0242 [Anaerolineae bacterium]
MFRQSNRGTMVWLVIVGLALLITLASGRAPTALAAALLAMYLGVLLAVIGQLDVSAMVRRALHRESPQAAPSDVAREATARARSLPNYESLYRLLDIGLIVDEQRPDGLALRRGRFISLDDDGIRPFAIVEVPPSLGGSLATVRFELFDGSGRKQYAYEAEKWLQPGENVLVPDYRLPVRKRAAELEAGGWSAHVSIDGGRAGCPSLQPGGVAR